MSNGDDAEKVSKEEQHNDATPKSLSVKVRDLWNAFFKMYLAWIGPHLNARDLKIAFRVAVAAWCGMLLLVIDRSREYMGYAAYLCIIIVFLNPPVHVIALQCEIILVSFILSAFAWAWIAFTIWATWAARSEFRMSRSEFFDSLAARGATAQIDISREVFQGQYLETSSSATLLVMTSIGLAGCFWLRTHISPSIHNASIVNIILFLLIVLSAIPFYPYPRYEYGLVFFIPFAFQMLINLACTLLVFPETLNHRFINQLIAVLRPLKILAETQKDVLATVPTSPEWRNFLGLKDQLRATSTAVLSLAKTQHLLSHEISIRRLSGRDSKQILRTVQRLAGRASGFIKFVNLVMRHVYREDGIGRKLDPLTEALNIRVGGASHHSRQSSFSRTATRQTMSKYPTNPGDESFSHERQSSTPSRAHFDNLFAKPIARSLGNMTPQRHRHQQYSTGSHMSSKYAELEALAAHQADEEHIVALVELLETTSHSVVDACCESIDHILLALIALQRRSFFSPDKGREDLREAGAHMISKLEKVLHEYDTEERIKVILPFASLFEPELEGDEDKTKPSHRGIYWALLYQYSLRQFAGCVLDLLTDVVRLEYKRKKRRLWIPSFQKILRSQSSGHEDHDDEADLDPSEIPGLHSSRIEPTARDPDALPPKTIAQTVGQFWHLLSLAVTRPTILFALKGGVLVFLLLLPSVVPAFAFRYYSFKCVWIPILASMSLLRWVGDTTHGFSMRLIGTFFGAALGLAVWEISRGNPIGLAAISAVVFLPGAFFSVFYPQPILSIISLSTAGLVVGYSYVNLKNASYANLGYGFRVAYIRFITTAIGLAASFIWSYIPPRSTQKGYLRQVYSRTIHQLGWSLCDAFSYANSRHATQVAPRHILSNIFSIRGKLRATHNRMQYIKFEVAYRGDWPTAEYEQLLELQIELCDWITLFLEAVSELPEPWLRAFLRRARLEDEAFLGQIFSALHQMSTSLASATPLPTFFTPLLSGFTSFFVYGFAVTIDDHDDLPRHVDLKMVTSKEYMAFSVATTSVYSILNRLDKIMFIVKTLCGESYAVTGTRNNPAQEEDAQTDEETDSSDGEELPLPIGLRASMKKRLNTANGDVE